MAFYLRFDLFDKRISQDSNFNIFSEIGVVCSHYGRNNLWIGGSEGIIYRFDKDFNSTMFNAYDTCVSRVHQCKERDILVTCGMDAATTDVVKIWDFSKWNKQNNPILVRSITSSGTSDPDFKVSCFNVLNNLNAMVLGLENGKVDLIYSDVLYQRKSKRKILHNMKEQITTVAINQINDLLYIYLTTANRTVILTFNEQTNDYKITLDTDQASCSKNCSALVNNVFLIGDTKGIYDVHYLEGFGSCWPLDGDNINLILYKHYLIVVKLMKPSVLSGTHHVNRLDQRSTTLNYQIVILDRINRFTAGEFQLPDFSFLFIEWGSIYVYCGPPTNKLFIFTEKDIQNKLKIFFQRNGFKIAIDVAKSQNFDEDALADMYRQYGDHLYREKHYEEAINAYIKTIGKLEPSFVIGQFYMTSQISNLIKYMEVLVESEYCTGEHNALLLNCYIISKENEKLKHFIQNHKVIKFDIDKIFNLLQKVHFFEEALELASRYDRHDWYLKILIEDQNKYNEAIEYISTLPLKETEEALLSYGNTLINVKPEILVEQLERVCDKQNDSKLNITTILKVFVNNRKGLKYFLKRYISKISSIDENYSIYVDTLLELLLYEVEKESDISKSSATEVMKILQSDKLLYHKSKALICCQIRGFTAGYRYLCELQENYIEILQSFKSENNIEGILETCHRFGSREPTLWIKALEYMIENDVDKNYFKDVIDEIERGSLISPLLLLEKMTISDHSLEFGLVKDFILHYYEHNEILIEEYKKEIVQLKEETKKNNDIIQDLDTEVQIFQTLKCMVCTSALEIPSVHFLCGHSFHMRCFETYTHSREQCPHCAPKIEDILSEINLWQSKKIYSLADIDVLSLEKLWHNILANSHHPIKIDPDEFLAEAFKEVSYSSDSYNKKKSSVVNDLKDTTTTQFKESSFVQQRELPIPTKINDQKVENKRVSTLARFSNQSPDRDSKIVAPVNPFELSFDPKHYISIPKSSFDAIKVRSSPLSNSNKSDDSKTKNPFGEISDDSGNSFSNSNPFGETKNMKEEYPNNLNPFE